MKLEGDYLFEATVPEVWSALFDPVILAAVMPGCEKLDLVDGQYVGEIKVKVGPIQGKFAGKVDLKDLNEPHSYTMIVDGRGAPGFVKATAGVKLAAEGSSTRVFYDADAQIGGKIASVGQRLIEASARAIVAQSLEGLHTNIKLRAAAYRQVASKQAAEPPSSASPDAAALSGPPAGPAEPAASQSPAAVSSSSAETQSAAAPASTSSPEAVAAAPSTTSSSTPPASPPSSASSTSSSASSPSTSSTSSPSASSPSASSPSPSSSASSPSVSSPSPSASASSLSTTSSQAASAPSKPAASTPVPVAFTPVKTKQSDLANAVAKEVASSLFPRSVLVAIIVLQAIVIIWLLVRS